MKMPISKSCDAKSTYTPLRRSLIPQAFQIQKYIRFIPLIFGIALSPSAASVQQRLDGKWLMENRKAEVQTYSCDDAVCGRVSRIIKYPKDGARTDIHNNDRSLRDRPLLGLPVLLSFERDGSAYKGRVYDPKSGRTYGATLTQQGRDKLTVKACLLFICKSQEWTRVR